MKNWLIYKHLGRFWNFCWYIPLKIRGGWGHFWLWGRRNLDRIGNEDLLLIIVVWTRHRPHEKEIQEGGILYFCGTTFGGSSFTGKEEEFVLPDGPALGEGISCAVSSFSLLVKERKRIENHFQENREKWVFSKTWQAWKKNRPANSSCGRIIEKPKSFYPKISSFSSSWWKVIIL